MATQINLPRDAEGREIPLNTRELCDKDGKRRKVDLFMFYPDKDRWDVVFKDSYAHFSPRNLSLDSPDSWEKLLDDLDNTAEKASSSVYIAPCCAWFSGGDRRCDDCPANESPGDSCNVQLVKNIAARIRRLRGEDDA